ncbi:MAG: AAA family ATPase [Candidatus Omnitrophica bacterium]|nr:AAA family ATPase [Candidatus Omnitrophota bacterium]
MKKVFIAATKQNDGKTTVALGMVLNLQESYKKVGFIKPVGQRYLEEEGLKIDEDSLLVEDALKAYGIKCKLKDMSPVAVEKGFTEKYILKPDPGAISGQIRSSFGRVASGQNLVVIEGTGHAGVGSVFDHSNAQVARMLGSKVILVSSGGIGRPIDEIMLDKAYFEKAGVKVLGVIVNKVMPEKFEKINDLVRRGFRRKGIDVLGVIPYKPILSYPTIRQIAEETRFKLVFKCDDAVLDNRVSRIVVGAMQPKDARKYIVDQSLVITPGDREDILKLALDSHKQKNRISGIVLSGDLMPAEEIIDAFKDECIPVMLSRDDTYNCASKIHDINIKIRPKDTEKIAIVKQIIRDYVDLDSISKRM